MTRDELIKYSFERIETVIENLTAKWSLQRAQAIEHVLDELVTQGIPIEHIRIEENYQRGTSIYVGGNLVMFIHYKAEAN